MKNRFYIVGLLSLWVLLFAPLAAGQDNETAPPSAEDVESNTAEKPVIPPSQEVEINEDNYRQFMELKDARLQREVIPENVFKAGSGLQKLEKLPEASQKHLRNELREIIVQGNPWQPGDEQGDFPYTPSVAASNNPGLEKQEREAWGELVDSYNQREAQIHANSAGSRAARGMQDASGAHPGVGQESTGNGGQDGEGSPGQQAGQQGKPDQADTSGTYSPNGSNDPSATSTAGVSQNAMEFLKGNAGQAQNQSEGDAADSQANPGQGETQADAEGLAQADEKQSAQESAPGESQTEDNGDAEASGQDDTQAQDGQQTETTHTPVDRVPPANASPVSSSEPEEESTAGASQNALEYLTGQNGQTTDSAGADPDAGQAEGTLTIQDLLNARGVGASTGTSPASTSAGDEQQADEKDPEKDGGGY